MEIIDILKEIGITDISVLPEKTQRKLKDYKRILNSPVGRKKDGQLHPGTKVRLDDLAEDIVLEAKVFLKKVQQQRQDADAESERKRLADEEAQRIADEETQRLANEETQRLAEEARKNPHNNNIPKSKGPLESLLGW
jgi:hypothetical protein